MIREDMEKGIIFKRECLHCGHQTWHSETKEDTPETIGGAEVYY